MAGLRLEVKEFTDLTRRRWVLTGADGGALADHEVRLDQTSWQFEAFGDLTGYLAWHVAPGRRREDEARIVAEVGEWIAAQVLGPIAEALVGKRGVTVTVAVPDDAQELLFRPLELTHVHGKPLSVQGVTLVMQAASSGDGDHAQPVSDRLRVVGLFRLPDGGQPLNLRRERHSLVTLIRSIHAQGKAADVRVLQYGVTRQSLQAVLEEPEGWDFIHISGHGTPGSLVLETVAGQPDRVTAADLASILDAARPRVKLVTLAACWSAILTANEQRRLLNLPLREDLYPERTRPAPPTATSSGSMATELAARVFKKGAGEEGGGSVLNKSSSAFD